MQKKNMKIAKKMYERNKSLYEESAISKTDFEKSENDMKELYNDYLLAEERLKILIMKMKLLFKIKR